MKTMIHPETGDNAALSKATITIPMGNLDGKHLSELMSFQEELTESRGPDSIVHTTMEAPDHPLRTLIELEYLEEGYDDIVPRSTISHTVANTQAGLPEMIIVGTDPDSAEALISEVEAAMRTEEGVEIGIPVLINDRLLQIIPVEFKQLSAFGDAFASFVATQVLSCQWGTPPTWLQIVYADAGNRFPWEPGADRDIYQPTATGLGRYQGRGTASA